MSFIAYYVQAACLAVSVSAHVSSPSAYSAGCVVFIALITLHTLAGGLRGK